MTNQDAPNLQDLALEEATLKALMDAVGDRYKVVRLQVQDAMETIRDSTGMIGSIAPALPDGTAVATISYTKGGECSALIEDTDVFLQWAIANAPTEIERKFVTTVRPAFVEKILSEMTAAGAPQICDADGVVQDVPGVALRPTRARGHSLRFKSGGKELIAQAWQSGTLALPGINVPELTE